jgi:hypothetical protein
MFCALHEGGEYAGSTEVGSVKKQTLTWAMVMVISSMP